MITQLKFVGIPTSDQKRALEFYTRKLGFEISTDQVFDERQRWIELRIANSATRIVLFTPEGHENRVGTFFKEPQKQPWGEFAMFQDPDGNQFVLSSS